MVGKTGSHDRVIEKKDHGCCSITQQFKGGNDDTERG